MFACLFILYISLNICEGGSTKKGVCIPPGTNFHCGDLAALSNIRRVYILAGETKVKIELNN